MEDDRPNDSLLVQDVARLIDRSGAQVRQLERQGVLRAAARTPNGTRLFSRIAVEEYLRARGDRAER